MCSTLTNSSMGWILTGTNFYQKPVRPAKTFLHLIVVDKEIGQVYPGLFLCFGLKVPESGTIKEIKGNIQLA
jgi:hypothetical protein